MRRFLIIVGFLPIFLALFLSKNTFASQKNIYISRVYATDGKEFVKDYFNDRDKKVEDLKIRIGNSELFEDTICVIKNQDVKHNDKELLKKLADYKAGKVQNSLMKGLLTNVSDSELESLADEISKFKK